MSKMSYEHTPCKRPLEGRIWHQLLQSCTEQYPNTEAWIMYDMDMKRSVMTFAEYRDRSAYLAASLLDLGVSRGQKVLLIGATSFPYMVFLMALHRIGANAILLGAGSLTPDKVNFMKTLNCQMIAYDPQMKESQTKQLMEGIQDLIRHNTDNKKEPPICVTLRDVDQILSQQTMCHEYYSLVKRGQTQGLQNLQEAQCQAQLDDPILALFTSGSTGEPKVVQHTMHASVNFFNTSSISMTLPRGKFCMSRPVSWAAGYLYGLAPLTSNLSMVIVPAEMALGQTTNEAVFLILEQEKCSYSMLNTALIQKLVTESMHLKYDLSSIKLFSVSGQRYSLSVVANIFELFPFANVQLLYGSTEAVLISDDVMGKQDAIIGRYGKMDVFPGVEVKLVDEDNKMVPRGTVGEICVRSCCVFLEYLENPGATKQVKSPTGWVYTGDTGTMDENGRIEVLGRKTETIKRATVKIFPAEIEHVISKHPSVANVVVVGIPDRRLHEEICACVIFSEDTKSETGDEKTKLQELEDWCEQQWPPGPDGLSLKPKYFYPMKKFPLTTATGKVFTRGVKAEAIEQLGVLKK